MRGKFIQLIVMLQCELEWNSRAGFHTLREVGSYSWAVCLAHKAGKESRVLHLHCTQVDENGYSPVSGGRLRVIDLSDEDW